MAQWSEQYPFDYSPRGGTIDELGACYVDEMRKVYQLLNELRENKEGVTEPQPRQLMISEQNKIYIRAANNMSWVYIGELQENLGLNALGFVKKTDIGLDSSGNITGNSTKIANATIDTDSLANNQVLAYDATNNKWVNKTVAMVNSDGKIVGSITGGANTIASFPIITENIQDGEILVYRPSLGGFVNETKASGIGAREISFSVNNVSIGNYSGVATKQIKLVAVGTATPTAVGNVTLPPVWLDTSS